MKNRILFVFFLSLILSCQTQKETKEIKIVKKVPSNFQMYKTSEMAELMRNMLAKNKEVRTQIIQGEEIGDFNKEYIKIHTAKLTDSTDLDENFLTYANHFEKMHRKLFEVSKEERKEQFNDAINSCIACHQMKCRGPIPRIKKLLIN
ncbi:hypothetical protein [Tenacibaculum sp. Cn5-34]|uniref:hypothetical protein n=1 Tax=Tenacibaculum sp. Cn5-34 TaxID=2908919 RepID=UPI001F2D7E8F|nr:hypothetical protein [Tenacibaculum sp. Cn5-34]MCF2933740.1 hypothetical protein [Tenacibaculum sp. Cn5-34]